MRYEQVSAAFFVLLTLVQVTRLVLQWPVTVAGFEVPLWASGIASLILLGFAFWGFRSYSRPSRVA